MAEGEYGHEGAEHRRTDACELLLPAATGAMARRETSPF
jgi:hypothetical protein